MPGNPSPDAEQLLKALIEQMRPAVAPETGLIGIHTGGVWVAERLHQALKPAIPFAALDVSYYRDDYEARGLRRDVKRSEIPFEVEGRDLILVDDVLYTGRTIRAALNELFDYGRPASVRLATLVDRGGRQLPIAAQFVGARVDVEPSISIDLTRGVDGRLAFVLNRRAS
ncbi:MAG: bifunctional pyr operon transcriptional regulator/uracil phosphoribosyltransferase PyrR [Betaproteobacteria bacterium]|nr:bifunctional pyr operon transcriptional regulator/uracil phosphoribosyltransferase PyrR [Betaproteobacteria bacterium]